MNWIKNLTKSEKQLMGYGAVILICVFSWILIYKPIIKKTLNQETTLNTLHQQLKEMQSSQSLLISQANNSFTNGINITRDINKPFITWIDEELVKNNLAIYVSRSEPKDNNTLILTFERVVFDDLIKWLQPLENNNQVRITEADINVIDRSNGLSFARITLEEKT